MSEIAEEKPAPAAEKEAEPASEKEVINTFQTLRQEASQLFTKINELENEKAEHALVIDAIKDLDPKRKCFRLIGGVLVERTVEEVLPAVEKNRDGLQQVIEKLMAQMRGEQKPTGDPERDAILAKLRKNGLSFAGGMDTMPIEQLRNLADSLGNIKASKPPKGEKAEKDDL